MTDTYHLRLRAGNSGTIDNELGLVVQLLVDDAPLDLTGALIVFRIVDERGQEVMEKTSAGTITVDLPTATITVPFTVADSRALSLIRPRMRYDMERRLGSLQRTFLVGPVTVEASANDD
jgi:hypothetical protein